jgi:hypothetical protein
MKNLHENNMGQNQAEPRGIISQFKSKFQVAFGHFAETTTFGGVNHTWVSTPWSWRMSWLLVLSLLLGATFWNTREVVNDYLSWPVLTTIQAANQESIPFPTVTVCNRNPVDCTKLAFAYIKHEEELNDLMYYSQCILTLTMNPLRSRIVSSCTHLALTR